MTELPAMARIIKFPDLCEGCGKPLDPKEGKICPVDGCAALGCRVCSDGSVYCMEHIKNDPDYGCG